jgi:hypothetical protein
MLINLTVRTLNLAAWCLAYKGNIALIQTITYTVCSESCCALWLCYEYSVVSVEVAVELRNCLIQFLLTVVLSVEECVFISAQQLFKRTI